ncbi:MULTISPECIES: hypothetical protein [unclassified Bradyrhizobium]|uniref:hypothetical protein n=1 Tax=unclassified Bradyrhizobium TaxID=2631580 RepID=UPI0029166970|nr:MULTISPECIES: hypothetical protein [unclassified Bradyrhizobium]
MIRFLCAMALTTLLIAEGAIAQGIDRKATLKQNRDVAVRVTVTGRNQDGQVVVRNGAGVMVRSNGTVATSKSLLGRDEDWRSNGGVPDRTIEVFATDEHGVVVSRGRASAQLAPPSEVAILQITGQNFPSATVEDGQVDDMSSAVLIIWEPDANGPDAVSGDLSADPGRFGDVLVVRALLTTGWEGAGLYGPGGRLIGVITKRIDDTRVAGEKIYSWLPRLPPPPNVRPNEKQVLECESAERDRRIERQPFTIANSIRCENMGDSQRGTVIYKAPPDFTIAGQVSKADETNYGTVGPIEYKNEGSRVTEARVDLSCSTPNRPFGPGGWAGSTLSGYIERVLGDADLNQIRQGCLRPK